VKPTGREGGGGVSGAVFKVEREMKMKELDEKYARRLEKQMKGRCHLLSFIY